MAYLPNMFYSFLRRYVKYAQPLLYHLKPFPYVLFKI